MAKRVTIESILETRYGVSLLECDAIAIEWAAAHLALLTDVWTAGQAWRRAESKRHKLGRHTTMPQWHDPLFDAFFAKTREEYDRRIARRSQLAA